MMTTSMSQCTKITGCVYVAGHSAPCFAPLDGQDHSDEIRLEVLRDENKRLRALLFTETDGPRPEPLLNIARDAAGQGASSVEEALSWLVAVRESMTAEMVRWRDEARRLGSLRESWAVESVRKDATIGHPEDLCQRCGGRNVVWFVSNEIWNRVAPDKGIICPSCFVVLAEQRGIVAEWELRWHCVRPEAAFYADFLGATDKKENQ